MFAGLAALSVVLFLAVGSKADVLPPAVELELSPGESTIIAKTVDVPEAPPGIDVFLLQDESGSFSDDILNLKSIASDVWDEVAAEIGPDFTMGVAGFRDFARSDWGDPDDHVYRLLQDLTSDKTDFINGINALAAGGGADAPEAQLEALAYLSSPGHPGIDSNGNGNTTDAQDTPASLQPTWGTDTQRVVLLATDAECHLQGDPPSPGWPGSALTSSVGDVAAHLASQGIRVISLVPGGSGESDCADELAAGTGGDVHDTVGTTGTAVEIKNAILAGLTDLPVAVVPSVVGCDPLDVTFDPPVASVPGGTQAAFQETIAVPAALAGGYVVNCQVHFLVGSASIGSQSISVTVPGSGSNPGGSENGGVGGTEVPTGAEVTAGNTPPHIECKWELPDMDSSTPGIQYQPAPGSHVHDDDMSNLDLSGVLPDTHPSRFPCDGPPSELPNQPDGVHNMITVLPNAEDQPEAVKVQLWAAVDHPNGLDAISDVYWKVFHPDESFKLQVHASEEYNGGVIRANNSDTSGCTSQGNWNVADSMFHAAYATGQVSPATIDDINNGLIALCQQEVKAFYYSEFEISKHQPCGEYRIELHAVSNGAESVLNNYIDVVCFYDLWIDFDNVNWGSIQPGVDKNIAGDLDPNTPNRPTVKNRGNAGMFIGVNFSPMIQSGTPGGKVIDQFDAAFGRSPSTLLHLDPIPASTVAWFDDDAGTNPGYPLSGAEQLLCSNEYGKLDLSIHPPSTLPAGIYTGTVQVLAKAAPADPWWNECLARFHAAP